MIILKTNENYLTIDPLRYEKQTHKLKNTQVQIHIHEQKDTGKKELMIPLTCLDQLDFQSKIMLTYIYLS